MAITYTPTTNFGAKDSLPTNDPDKVIKGSEFTTEFTALQTAFSLAAPNASPTFTGTVTIPTADINGGAIDGTVIGAVTPAAASFTTVSATGNITVGGTVDGRDVAADGTKLDGIEAGADVTDTTNVTAAGALMDSELANIAAVKALNQGVATTDSPSFAGLTATGSVSLAGASTTADITFGDNDKAIFGAGSDLQIYHDGSTSIIKDAGTGELQLHAENNLRLQNLTGSTYAKFTNGAQAELYYGGNLKLATTATGIDVTGTVTADGLTSAGDVNIQKTAAGASQGSFDLIFQGTNSSSQDKNQAQINSARWESNSNAGILQFYTANNLSTFVKRMDIDGGGDISFYEDTGTTPKFFWDASAEALGIGDSSPDGILDVEGSITIAGSQAGVIFNPSVTPANNNVGSIGLVSGTLNAPASVNASSKISGLRVAPTTSGSFNGAGEVAGVKVETFNGQSATLATGLYVDAPTGGDVNYAAILNGGNVGIGTSSPAYNLDVSKGSAGTAARFTASTDNGRGLSFISSDNGIFLGAIWTRDVASGSGIHAWSINSSEKMRINSSGNVGIGTASPTQKLHVVGDYIRLVNAADTQNILLKADTSRVAVEAPNGTLAFDTASSERMRIDASGNLLVGKTASGTATAGVEALSSGFFGATRDAALVGSFTRNTSDGPIVDFVKDGSSVGSIQTNSGRLDIQGASNTVRIASGTSLMQVTNGTQISFETAGSEAMRIDSSGNLLVGTTSSSGAETNTARITGGLFSTHNGTQSVAYNTATTVATFPSGEANYIVSASLINSGAPATYNAVAVVGTSQSSAAITTLNSTSGMTLSMSGLNLQVTQGQGTTQTIAFSILRLL